jgi:hypothetical protein
MHISIFCAPAAESPAGAGAWADTATGNTNAQAAASKDSLVIDRLSSDCRNGANTLAAGVLKPGYFTGCPRRRSNSMPIRAL